MPTKETSKKVSMYTGPWASKLVRYIARAAIVGAVVTVIGFTYWEWNQVTCQICYAVWALLPPSFLFIEAAYLYNWDYPKFELFKHLQDVSKAFWGALLVVLGVAYIARFGFPLPKP